VPGVTKDHCRCRPERHRDRSERLQRRLRRRSESPPATTTEQVETQPPAQPTVDISTFRAAFEETFGTPPDERPWYGLITGMKMAPREIVTAASSYRVLEITTKKLESEDRVADLGHNRPIA